jgi:hypothetical protein
MVEDGRPLLLIIAVTALFVALADDDDEEEGFESCCDTSVDVPGELFDMDDVFALAEP